MITRKHYFQKFSLHGIIHDFITAYTIYNIVILLKEMKMMVKAVKRFIQFLLFHKKTTKLQTKTSILVKCILLQRQIAAHSNLADHVKFYH